MKERQYDMTHEEKMKLLIDEKYPLSAKYDPEWIYENKMGSSMTAWKKSASLVRLST